MVFNFEPFVIERGKIKQFAQSLGFTNPIYYDLKAARQNGYKDIPVPPTFATVIDFWNDSPYYLFFKQLNILPENVLHGEQSYEYFYPIYAGYTITGEISIVDRNIKKGNLFIYLKTTYTNQLGEVVLVGNATLIDVKGNAKV